MLSKRDAVNDGWAKAKWRFLLSKVVSSKKKTYAYFFVESCSD